MAQAAFQTEVTLIPEMPEAGTLHVRGKATFDEAPELRKKILAELGRLPAEKVVIELADVREMDTAGAAVLAEAFKYGINRGKRVLFCSPSVSVLNIFRLAGFDDVLNQCCSDPQETWRRLQE